ncbi:hypothetical protein Poli38472_010703 [Pythium oligandrum]|uniref:Serine aminopeptidase S33 domain-containing protein n=1 Tax=Pythium oligandrum TaxID=41045 RepID=A0A8K1CF33_PYTOL|nr:hypothetical protein Poli38472_010703 [Pythium oligandrum]|eukprot:TMW61640.1 hypothetical protein Poli38472_010703 [Pythium oligandrum]
MAGATPWRVLEGAFTSTRSQSLAYYATFPPQEISLRGVVLFVHGIGEYARRFTHLFDALCADGFGVIAYDMIGHGRSDCDYRQERGHAELFQHMVDDTNAFITFAKKTIYPEVLGDTSPPALIFMGMSYGTLVGLHTVLSEQHSFSGMVLTAPAISVEWTCVLKCQAIFMRPLGKLIPHMRITPGVNYNYLSRDPAFVADYLADSMVIKAKMTARMALETLKAMKKLRTDTRVTTASSAFCQIPVLFVQGSADKITSVAQAEEFHRNMATKDKRFEKLDGLFHCIFDEPEKEQVMKIITSWLNERFSPSSEDFLTVEDAEEVRGAEGATVQG